MTVSLEVISLDKPTALRMREDVRDYFVVELVGPSLAASVRVNTFMMAGFADFFAGMAAAWRGWTGEKMWRSIEGELLMRATSDRLGHITITADICAGAPPAWTVSSTILLEAGQLGDLARAARRFEDSVLHAS
jgi:hypothetical protein